MQFCDTKNDISCKPRAERPETVQSLAAGNIPRQHKRRHTLPLLAVSHFFLISIVCWTILCGTCSLFSFCCLSFFIQIPPKILLGLLMSVLLYWRMLLVDYLQKPLFLCCTRTDKHKSECNIITEENLIRLSQNL